jgi:hypothetical protein
MTMVVKMDKRHKKNLKKVDLDLIILV